MLEEKDCRRCEKLNEEGKCTRGLGASFEPTLPVGCSIREGFTPVLGRDCRNCQRFNGKGQHCTDMPDNRAARTFNQACDDFYSIQTSKPSPTILTQDK